MSVLTLFMILGPIAILAGVTMMIAAVRGNEMSLTGDIVDLGPPSQNTTGSEPSAAFSPSRARSVSEKPIMTSATRPP